MGLTRGQLPPNPCKTAAALSGGESAAAVQHSLVGKVLQRCSTLRWGKCCSGAALSGGGEVLHRCSTSNHITYLNMELPKKEILMTYISESCGFFENKNAKKGNFVGPINGGVSKI